MTLLPGDALTWRVLLANKKRMLVITPDYRNYVFISLLD